MQANSVTCLPEGQAGIQVFVESCTLTALARGFSDCHFERGEGPGEEVVLVIYQENLAKCSGLSRESVMDLHLQM